MFGKRIKLFRLLGFDVHVDVSWIIIFVFITWTLARGVFPAQFENLASSTYWWMGFFGTLALFASIVFHELSHSVVARQYGIRIKGITLFIFGGVAEMEDEPPNPKAELLMAIAGPAASFLLAGILWLVYQAGSQANLPVAVNGVVWYVAFMNAVLAVFNLVPAFPLDGGRVLRAILWSWKGSIRWATRITSQMGTAFGTLLIVLGIVNIISGFFIPGFWWCLIGLFVRNASQMSYQQVLIRRALEGEPVRRFMANNPIAVPSNLSIEGLVEDFVYAQHHKMFPVVDNGRLTGCVTTQQIKQVPRSEWSSRTVHDISTPCSNENTIAPNADAMDALAAMSRSSNSRLMVVEDHRLLGVVSLKDLLRFIEVKIDLELGD